MSDLFLNGGNGDLIEQSVDNVGMSESVRAHSMKRAATFVISIDFLNAGSFSIGMDYLLDPSGGELFPLP